MLYLIIVVESCIILYALYMIHQSRQYRKKNNKLYISADKYSAKPLMTDYEYNFYLILKNIEDRYLIIPQLNLASVIKKNYNNKYYNDLFRNIDFAIFTKDCKKLLLLIELNDATHNTPERKERDYNIRKICEVTNIKLIRFYTNKPNEPYYVINRVLNEIEKE